MIALIFVLVIIGIVLEVLKTQIPMDPTIRLVIQVIIVLGVVYYLWTMFGAPDIPLPHRR